MGEMILMIDQRLVLKKIPETFLTLQTANKLAGIIGQDLLYDVNQRASLSRV